MGGEDPQAMLGPLCLGRHTQLRPSRRTDEGAGGGWRAWCPVMGGGVTQVGWCMRRRKGWGLQACTPSSAWRMPLLQGGRCVVHTPRGCGRHHAGQGRSTCAVLGAAAAGYSTWVQWESIGAAVWRVTRIEHQGAVWPGGAGLAAVAALGAEARRWDQGAPRGGGEVRGRQRPASSV